MVRGIVPSLCYVLPPTHYDLYIFLCAHGWLKDILEMEMKKLHMGTMSYGFDSMDEVAHQLASAFGADQGAYFTHPLLSSWID
jgi:hypothetical protein